VSAPRSWAARKTFRPMRPKPLMPALKAIRPSFRSLWRGGTLNLSRSSGPQGRLVGVAVHHLDHVFPAPAVDSGQVLGDHHRAVTPARAADSHRQVGLALVLVGGP